MFEFMYMIDPSPAPQIPVPITVSNSSNYVALFAALTALITALGALFTGYLSHKSRMRELELEAEALRDERADRRRHDNGPPHGKKDRRQYSDPEDD